VLLWNKKHHGIVCINRKTEAVLATEQRELNTGDWLKRYWRGKKANGKHWGSRKSSYHTLGWGNKGKKLKLSEPTLHRPLKGDTRLLFYHACLEKPLGARMKFSMGSGSWACVTGSSYGGQSWKPKATPLPSGGAFTEVGSAVSNRESTGQCKLCPL
jgi:hypothetical protein